MWKISNISHHLFNIYEPKMDFDKQLLLLELWICSPRIFTMCNSIIQSDYFDHKLEKLVAFTKTYHKEHKRTPPFSIIKGELGLNLLQHEISPDMIEWCSTELEKFCRTQAMRKVLLEAPKLLSANNDGAILAAWKEASQISLVKDLGHNYLSQVRERVDFLIKESPIISTGLPWLDEYLQPRRQEIFLVSANSGGGKSLTMGNFAFNYMVQGYKVLYISLEMQDKRIAQRIDSIITGFNPKEYSNNSEEIYFILKQFAEINEKENKGDLDIVRLRPQIDANGLRSYIDEYVNIKGHKPDVILVDYMGRMTPIDKTIKEAHTKDERIMDELKEIAVDYDAVLWTGSQQTRGTLKSKTEDIGQDALAGGMAKINPTDGAIACIFNDVMKFAGEIAYKVIKARNSEKTGALVYADWINKSMRIGHREINKSRLSGAAKDELTRELETIDTATTKKPVETARSSFLDMVND